MEPKWEDPECEHGGKWTVLVSKGAASKQALDTMWLNLVRLGWDGVECAGGLGPTPSSVQARAPQNKKKPHPSSLSLSSFLHFSPQLLACIGEQFADGDEVCGAVVNVRAKQDKVCLWTRTAANEAAQVGIGKQLKAVLDLDSAAQVGFLVHADAKAYDRSAKERYIV